MSSRTRGISAKKNSAKKPVTALKPPITTELPSSTVSLGAGKCALAVILLAQYVLHGKRPNMPFSRESRRGQLRQRDVLSRCRAGV